MKLKRIYLNMQTTIMVLMLSLGFLSCGHDDEIVDINSGGQVENNSKSSAMDATYESLLSGTSWKQSSSYVVYTNPDYSERVSTKVGKAIMTFASNYTWFVIGVNGTQDNGWGTWKVENGEIKWHITGNNTGESDAIFRSQFAADLGAGAMTIATLTDSKMRLVYKKDGFGSIDEDKSWHEYTRVSYQELSGVGGGGSSTESLYFTNFNYTATQTSVTVKFYTNERASSATIKYGEYSASSSTSATITNKEISATIRGLKRGTKYYVKCTARNSNGSVTSDEYPVMTNY